MTWNIKGSIVLLGYKPVAQFESTGRAWEYAQFLSRQHKGQFVTLLESDSYCTTVCDDAEPESVDGEVQP